ncbi:MAG: hypothetical protein QM778_32950 [Myxococcales bacterium]
MIGARHSAPLLPTVLSRRALIASTLLLALSSAVPGSLAHADAPPAQPAAARAEVTIILGHTEGSGVSPELEKIEALKKAPFDAFPKKALLKKVDLTIGIGSSQEVELPNGRKLKLSVLERSPSGGYRVSVSINKPGQQDYLPVMTVVAAPGDPFFVAGQKHEGGTLIVGVSVR